MYKCCILSDLADENIKLQKKIHALKMQVVRLKKKIVRKHDNLSVKKLVNESKASKKRMAHLQTQLAEYLSGQKLTFVMSQIRSAVRKSANGRRWSYKDKAFALSLLHSSPKTYRLLQRIFDLPSVKTLKLVMKNIAIRPGFNDIILQALEKKMAGTPSNSKLVALTIDEVAIKEGVSYNNGLDIIEGYTDGVTKTNEFANHALVFMIRGIVDKWKQAVGYFLSSGPMKGCDMKVLLLQCIEKLKAIGLKVVVVIGDQGSNNRNLFETQLGVSTTKPYVEVGDEKVCFMYDPPHLLKNIRNNLKKHNLKIDDKDISWQHIKAFYEKDSSNKCGIRMAPKLTAQHFSLAMFGALSVPMAAQVLSHTVAAGMAVMAECKGTGIPEEALETAKFVEDMDQLFNAFNSRTFSSAAVMRHAMTETSGHKEFLKKKLDWLKKLKSNGKIQPYCINGWQLSIQALLMIWDVLHKDYNLTFLLTSRLNQDPLENFFSIIRRKGIQRVNPDAAQFRAAFRQCMVDSVMMPGKNANCEEDVDKFLLTLKNVDTVAPTPPTPIQPPSTMNNLPEAVKSVLAVCALPPDDGLTYQETNILAYIGGYIVRKLQKRNAICHECDEKIAGEIEEDDQRHQFLLKKNIQEAKVGLSAPSNDLLGVLQHLEIEYNKIIDECIRKQQGVKATLIATLLANGKLGRLRCSVCHLDKLIVHLMTNIRLHHTIKMANRSLKENKNRKNHKILKFSHM